MSTEERILRIENAVATLAELSGQHDVRLAAVERSFQTLVALSVRASERMDTHQDWINQLGASRAEADARMTALTDAEIRADDRIAGLTEGQRLADARAAEADARLAELAAAQTRNEASIAALAEGQRLADTRAAEADARIAEIAEAHKQLTEAHRHTEEVVSRLGVKVDALVEAVRGRGGGGAG